MTDLRIVTSEGTDLFLEEPTVQQFAAGLRGPLTLIVAPAGFGKTTLLSEWHATGWPAAWLALDAGDNDLARFLRYVVAALQTLQPDIGLGVLASLPLMASPSR